MRFENAATSGRSGSHNDQTAATIRFLCGGYLARDDFLEDILGQLRQPLCAGTRLLVDADVGEGRGGFFWRFRLSTARRIAAG